LAARVRLEPPRPAHHDELVALARDWRRYHRPWVYLTTAEETWTRYFQRLQDGHLAGYLVRARDTGALVGVVNLSEIVRGPLQSAYMGFYGSAAHAGRGLMREGVALVLAEAFRRLKLHRVEANVQPANRRSLRLVRAVGFRREGFSPRYLKIGGRWRDHERWALTVEDWRAFTARSAGPLPRRAPR